MRIFLSMRNLGRCVNADWVDCGWTPLFINDFTMVRKTDSWFPLSTHNTWVMLGFIILFQLFFNQNLICSLLQSNFHHNEITTGGERFWKATWHLLVYESFPLPYSYIGILNWTSWHSAGPRGLGTSVPWIWNKNTNIHYIWMYS